MSEKIFNKLVRDRIPEIIIESGSTPTTSILNDDDYRTELDRKLQEECGEAITAVTRNSRLEELADVLEVLTAMAELEGSTIDEIMQIREKKKQERGGFSERIFLEKTSRA